MVVIISDACKISDDLNFLGFIYKIYVKDYPHRIYIGQTRGRTSQGKEKILDIRWRRHCKDAKDSREKELNLSKAADLHSAMITNSIPNIKFDVFGVDQNQPIWSDKFKQKLSQAKMAINLSQGSPSK